MTWCAICRSVEATQKRYPREYRRREKGVPVCDVCASVWDEGRGR